MDALGSVFLVLSAAASFPFALVVRNLIRIQPTPSIADLYFRTGAHQPAFTLHNRLVEQVLESRYGKSQWVDLGKNQMTSTAVELQGTARELLAKRMPFEIVIDGGKSNAFAFASDHSKVPGPTLDTTSFDQDLEAKKQPHIHSIRLGKGRMPISIEGLRIDNLQVGAECESAWVFVHNSYVKTARFEGSTRSERPMIHFTNSWINLLHFEERSCGDIHISGGGIKNIRCPTPSGKNPFVGDVRFSKDAQLVVQGGQGVIGGEQDRRSLRAHLHALENSDADRYVFAFEKRVERAQEGLFLRVLSAAYDALSFYGNSPARAASWLLGATIYSLLLVFAFNGTSIPLFCSDATAIKDWTANLCTDELSGRIYRSVVFTLQHAVNPFGVFSTRNLIQASSFWINMWMVLESIFALILVALIVLSLRRKFRAS